VQLGAQGLRDVGVGHGPGKRVEDQHRLVYRQSCLLGTLPQEPYALHVPDEAGQEGVVPVPLLVLAVQQVELGAQHSGAELGHAEEARR
jgi:hypothetical protein